MEARSLRRTCTCARCERICSLVGDVKPLIRMTWKWRIRKNHNDETLPLRWGFAGVGRKFDEEARNACIKGDATAHTQALWLHEPCGGVYGSGPRNFKRENLGETKDQENEEEGLRAGFLAAFSILDTPLLLMFVAVASCLVSGSYALLGDLKQNNMDSLRQAKNRTRPKQGGPTLLGQAKAKAKQRP
ncbi:hypothetical protein YC2023_045164 [Brassica napus]